MKSVDLQNIFYAMGKRHSMEIVCYIGLNNLHYIEIYRHMAMNSGNLKESLDNLVLNNVIHRERSPNQTLYKLTEIGVMVYDFSHKLKILN